MKVYVFFLYMSGVNCLLKELTGRLPLLDGNGVALTADIDVSKFNSDIRKIISEDLVEEIAAKFDAYINSTELKNFIENSIAKEMNGLLEKIQGSGDTYIRWGRTGCPLFSKKVYSGYTGGGWYLNPGSPAEPVCLPTDPNFLRTSGENNAFIYGTEFESKTFGSGSSQQDVPCVVCEVSPGATAIMIPGKTICNEGWKRQYYGNLAAGYATNNNHASAYVCIDIQPEYIKGGKASKDGNLFYEVVAKCGSLPCPPYHDGYPISCVVCSK